MHLIFHIVYGAHANGTHDKLALDALRHLKSADAKRWRKVFLLHARLYLEGAGAPDDEFKDFQNHVLLTRDGLWGGAPAKVRSWYNHVVEALAVEDWPTAVYCAGVLSHYYTDPLQPFHTAQSEAENNIHRAVEWSVARSYDALCRLGRRDFADMPVELGTDPNWLIELVCRGAARANAHYEKLIAHYDIDRGVVDPPAGLDRVARRIVAEMLRYAQVSFAAVLDRAIAESGVLVPEARLTAATLAAAAQAPARMVANAIADGRERRRVEAIYDELQATGTVEQHLPEAERLVRERYAREVLARREPAQVSQVFPFKPRERVFTRIDRERAARRQEALLASAVIIPLQPPGAMVPASATVPVAAASAHESSVTRQPMLFVLPSGSPGAAADAPAAAGAATGALPAGAGEDGGRRLAPEAVPMPTARKAKAGAADKGAFQLTLDHDLGKGPAIGAKTVKRLQAQGIATVRDLLKADPEALAGLMDSRQITPQTVGAWQDQALVMCGVPGLKAAHAQLLVGAGYRSAEAIAAVEAEKLCADVMTFATTPAGQRALRNGEVPDLERIRGWLEAARSMQAA